MTSRTTAAWVVALTSGITSAQRLNPSSHRLQNIQEEKTSITRLLSTKTEPEKQTKEGDLVINLPGLDPLTNVTHHAGRIALGNSDKNVIFYWHFQASQDADKAPLIIWLNGGPGCSSMQGVFLGSSPFKLVDESTIAKNEHSWHQFANLLFVDQPIGTGMSYKNGNDVRKNEEVVSADFYEFLIKFLQRHSEYLAGDGEEKISRAVYMFGESHAGRWIPKFTKYILQENDGLNKSIKIRLEGGGIGSGWVHPRIQYEYSDYAHGLGLLTFGQVRSLKASYNDCVAALDGGTYNTKSCFRNMDAIMDSVKTDSKQLNIYDVRQYVHKLTEYPSGHSNIVKYMNKMEVRKALHGNEDPHFRFSICSDNVFGGLSRFDGVSTLEEVQSLLQGGFRMLFYNGQWDMMCNHYGTEKVLLSLDWNGSNAYQQAKKYIWRVKGRREPAGFAQHGGNLTYLVVTGAGHMMPMDVPEAAADMVYRFINGLEFNDKAQSVTNTRFNATDFGVSLCYESSLPPATSLEVSTLNEIGGSSGLGMTWLWAALVVATVSSILSVCVTLACLRTKRDGQPEHDMLTQTPTDDEELMEQIENDDERESFSDDDGDEHVVSVDSGSSERQVLILE